MASIKKATTDTEGTVPPPQENDAHGEGTIRLNDNSNEGAPLVKKDTQAVKIVTAHVVQATGETPLKRGTLLIICAKPGFRRAGIEHERLKLWDKNTFTAEQIDQLRHEPMLTLIEVR